MSYLPSLSRSMAICPPQYRAQTRGLHMRRLFVGCDLGQVGLCGLKSAIPVGGIVRPLLPIQADISMSRIRNSALHQTWDRRKFPQCRNLRLGSTIPIALAPNFLALGRLTITLGLFSWDRRNKRPERWLSVSQRQGHMANRPVAFTPKRKV